MKRSLLGCGLQELYSGSLRRAASGALGAQLEGGSRRQGRGAPSLGAAPLLAKLRNPAGDRLPAAQNQAAREMAQPLEVGAPRLEAPADLVIDDVLRDDVIPLLGPNRPR